MTLARIVYEIRWWRWFLFTGKWPYETLYGDRPLDKQSRRIIINRVEDKKASREPMFNGTYPHRKAGE